MATFDLECNAMVRWHRRGEIRIHVDDTFVRRYNHSGNSVGERMIDEIDSCFANTVADLSAVPR